jgi:hypothetical protein
VPADVDEPVVHDAPEVVARRREDWWKHNAKFEESVRNHPQPMTRLDMK